MLAFRNQTDRPARFEGVSILLIEDNPDHLYLIKITLEECMPGITAIGVSDRQAVEDMLIPDNKAPMTIYPRLILLDLYLPTRAEGLLVLQTIKEHFQKVNHPPVPVVVFSYSDSQEDIQLCYRHGANAYLVKSTNYPEWRDYFSELRDFWLETATLPTRRLY